MHIPLAGTGRDGLFPNSLKIKLPSAHTLHRKTVTRGITGMKLLFFLCTLLSGLASGSVLADQSAFEALPNEDLFKPLIASPRESQFSLRREYYETHEGNYNAAVVSFGDYLPITNYKIDEQNILQFSIDGSLYALFNLDKESYDLINTDYFFGLSMSHRWSETISSRLRLYHGSSHLGDEFLIDNPEFERDNSSYENLQYILAYHTESMRFYGGGGYIVRSNNEIKLDPWQVKGGFEFSHPLPEYEQTSLLFAWDMESLERANWRFNNSIMLGLSLLKSEAREIRLLGTFYRGSSPQGQFFNERLKYYGLGLYFIV